MGPWDSDYTADDLGLVDTATKAAKVIDTRIIPFSSRMSCELQICSWEKKWEFIFGINDDLHWYMLWINKSFHVVVCVPIVLT